MANIELRPPSSLTVPNDGWKWDGDARYAVVADRLKRARVHPEPYSNYGLAFSLVENMTAAGFIFMRGSIGYRIESRIYDTRSVVGLSRRAGSFTLSELMEQPEAFCIDIIHMKGYRNEDSIAMPMWGPVYSDPVKFAATFFFTLQAFVDEKRQLLGGSFEDLRIACSSEPPTLGGL